MILYVHIPFCHRICPYCSFYKHTSGGEQNDKFIQSIIKEAEDSITALSLTKTPINTLYFGGGTPSMLSPKHLTRLIEGLCDLFSLENTHITLEANPATFGASKAELFCALGINRISLGVQSFNTSVLKILGREHTVEDARKSVYLLRNAGMDEINIDLMFSVPRQSSEQWKESLKSAVKMEPDHISAYNLTYEEDTEFFYKLKKGHYSDSQDEGAHFFMLAHNFLEKHGYIHYETSNYALPGKQSSHNQAYWRGDDYLGLGPSAVSTIKGTRWKNIPDTTRYIESVTQGHNIKSEIETITEEDYRIERIALLLRTREGLPAKYLKASPTPVIENLIKNELAEWSDGSLRLINNGTLLVDSIAIELI